MFFESYIETVSLPKGKGKVNDILCAICDRCAHVVSIPQQSVPRIREVMNTKKYSIEARLPHHLLDILLLAGDRFEIGNPQNLKDPLIRYYISLAEQDRRMTKSVKKLSSSEDAKGAGNRISLKVNESIFERFENLREMTSLSKTQLLKGIILQINEDILQKPDKKKLSALEKALLASA